eukprot:gene12707-6905_t
MSKIIVKSHSKSLFNLSQSKGWTEEENKVFKQALMRFGIGSWTTIAQRIIGQQSLGGFLHMRVNPDQVRKDNEERAKKGIVTVKSGLIINTGENPTKESRREIYEENKKKYELTLEQVEELVSDDDLFIIKRKKRIKFTNFVENYVKENLDKMEVEEKSMK